MALKIMPLDAMDKKFFDDNMLTDEDFRFETEEFDVTFEDQELFKEVHENLQILNSEIFPYPYINNPSVEQTNILDPYPEFLKDILDVKYKVEPPSPNSSDSSEVYSTDNDVSVITIPDVTNTIEVPEVLTDTPPHTPCGITDILPDSPVNPSGEPIIVSVGSLPGVSCAMSQNTQAVINPVKYAVNIQPKLETKPKETKKMSIQSIIPRTSHKTVLTPEQMEKLAKGTLQLRAPPNVTVPYSKVIQNNKVTLDSLTAKVSAKNGSGKKNSVLNDFEICAAAIKRQERIIKNRESAYLSRKRKKEYVQKLEAELNQITAENSNLREENCRLKLRISNLEKEVLKLKTSFSPKNAKRTICFMVVLFMLTFNFAPYSSIFEKVGPPRVKPESVNHRVGRTLLWNADNTGERNETKSFYRKLRHVSDKTETTYIVDLDKSYNVSSCQHYINKSESLRLESDLLGWVERVEKKRVQTKLKKQKFHMDSTFPHIAAWSRRRADINKDIWARRKNRNEILIYETPRTVYEDFFDAIHRRDDTFYFVSFSGDHLLLPAITHNKTLRPRMSFVMPAMTLNESVGDSDDHISMMQIDCEVMDTKLVHIKESVIPEHLRQKQNATKSHSRNPSEYSSYRQPKRLQSGTKLPQKSRTNS